MQVQFYEQCRPILIFTNYVVRLMVIPKKGRILYVLFSATGVY